MIGVRLRCMIGSDEAIERERAAGLLKRAALRLEVVDLSVVPFDAAAEGVLSLVPTQVRAGDILVVAEKERICGLGIAQVCLIVWNRSARRRLASREDESRIAIVEGWVTGSSRVIGSGDPQIVESVGRDEVKGRPEPLASEAEVPIQQYERSERVGGAETDVLNQAGSIAKLSAIGGITYCRHRVEVDRTQGSSRSCTGRRPWISAPGT